MWSPPSASWVVSVGLGGLSALLLVTWLVLTWRAAPALVPKLGLVLAAWPGLWFGLAATGVLASKPPVFVLLIPSLTVGCVMLARSRIGAALAQHTPLWLLVIVQTFRLPLELVMHEAAHEGVMPAQMSFGGGGAGLNYDIVTGVTALLLGIALALKPSLPRALVIAWNVMGLSLLTIVVVVSGLSTPMLARFGHDPSQLNTWIFYAPYVGLPAVLVGSALFGHLLIFRAIKKLSVTSIPTHASRLPGHSGDDSAPFSIAAAALPTVA